MAWSVVRSAAQLPSAPPVRARNALRPRVRPHPPAVPVVHSLRADAPARPRRRRPRSTSRRRRRRSVGLACWRACAALAVAGAEARDDVALRLISSGPSSNCSLGDLDAARSLGGRPSRSQTTAVLRRLQDVERIHRCEGVDGCGSSRRRPVDNASLLIGRLQDRSMNTPDLATLPHRAIATANDLAAFWTTLMGEGGFGRRTLWLVLSTRAGIQPPWWCPSTTSPRLLAAATSRPSPPSSPASPTTGPRSCCCPGPDPSRCSPTTSSGPAPWPRLPPPGRSTSRRPSPWTLPPAGCRRLPKLRMRVGSAALVHDAAGAAERPLTPAKSGSPG